MLSEKIKPAGNEEDVESIARKNPDGQGNEPTAEKVEHEEVGLMTSHALPDHGACMQMEINEETNNGECRGSKLGRVSSNEVHDLWTECGLLSPVGSSGKARKEGASLLGPRVEEINMGCDRGDGLTKTKARMNGVVERGESSKNRQKGILRSGSILSVGGRGPFSLVPSKISSKLKEKTTSSKSCSVEQSRTEISMAPDEAMKTWEVGKQVRCVGIISDEEMVKRLKMMEEQENGEAAVGARGPED